MFVDPQYMHSLRSRRRCFSSSVRCPDEVTWFPGIFGRSGFVFGFVEGLKVAEGEEAVVLMRGVLATGDDWEMDVFWSRTSRNDVPSVVRRGREQGCEVRRTPKVCRVRRYDP